MIYSTSVMQAVCQAPSRVWVVHSLPALQFASLDTRPPRRLHSLAVRGVICDAGNAWPAAVFFVDLEPASATLRGTSKVNSRAQQALRDLRISVMTSSFRSVSIV